MVLALITLLTGLAISAVAIYYSVIGLAAIFSAAFIPIIVMGTILEVSKLVTAWWLKANWSRAPVLLKSYMLVAVIVLMLITSMGIFGFLSKAHTDQNLISGDVMSKISIYDEKIKTEKENIDVARKALKQLDDAVDQVMARSSDERGADKAAQIRRTQQRERAALQRDIVNAQSNISKLQSERAPIAAEVRKVEAEVGPIKYIAKLIYGENTDTNLLEKAVSWVIVTIVFVFDPLAVLLLLASQMSFQWARESKANSVNKDNDTEEKIIEEKASEEVTDIPIQEPEKDTFDISKHAYLNKPWVSKVPGVEPVGPLVYKPEPIEKVEPTESVQPVEKSEQVEPIEEVVPEDDAEILETANVTEKEAMHIWKSENPNGSLKNQRSLLAAGKIDELPWMKYLEPQPDFQDDNNLEEDKKKELVSWMEKNGQQQIRKTKEI